MGSHRRGSHAVLYHSLREMPPFKLDAENKRSFVSLAVVDLTGEIGGNSFVDQALDVFKANILFKQFKIETDVDRVLVYITLYIIDCLKKLQKCSNKERAAQTMKAAALEAFALPGDSNFPLNAFFSKPKTSQEKEELKKYMTQMRQVTGSKLVERVFSETMDRPSKWWTCWSKRKFLNVSLEQAY